MEKYVYHLIRSLSTTTDQHLVAQFDDGSIKSYDVRELAKRNSVFRAFESKPELFSKARVDVGGYGVVWNGELDLSAEEIWINGTTIDNPFNGLLAFSDASRIWNLNESTLRKALVYGKIKAGVDCCKYGKQWVITKDAMFREYGRPESIYRKEDTFHWEEKSVAEKMQTYNCSQANGLDKKRVTT